METIEELVKKAVKGDKVSLEKIVKEIQDLVYNLALRMLWHPEEAKDATQEILIKTITSLAKFEHRSKFKTWVYRLASNELLNFKGRSERQRMNFDDFSRQLAHGLNDQISFTSNLAEQNLLIQEAKVGCSHAMLQCLDQESRITYVIGEILEFNSQEAANILDIKPETFRKRLSRIRKSMRAFVQNNCGLVNSHNSCRCYKKVDSSIRKNIIDPSNLLFADGEELVEKIESVQNEVALYQSNPNYSTPTELFEEVKRIVTTSDM